MAHFEPFIWGLALAACAGFRAFVPLLFVGAMARWGPWPEPPVIGWVASDEGIIILLIASVVEVLGDKIPIVDHALDTVQTLVKPVAGLLLTVGMLHEWSPAAAWILGFAAGAPVALGLHATKATTRAGSTAVTGGLGNTLLSILEDALAALLIVLALLAPILALLLVVWLITVAVRGAVRLLGRRKAPGV